MKLEAQHFDVDLIRRNVAKGFGLSYAVISVYPSQRVAGWGRGEKARLQVPEGRSRGMGPDRSRGSPTE